MDITKRLCRILSESFKNSIRLSFIGYRNIVIVTKDDRVYQFDEDFKENYCPVEYCKQESEPKTLIDESIVEELCGKCVVDIKNGVNHNIAHTSDEKIYVWGNCDFGIIGSGTTDLPKHKPVMNEYLKDLNIIDMSCGYFHTLVLTSSGDIYGWNSNEYGETGNGNFCEYQTIPFKMNGLISEKFKSISCGAMHSMALTEDGRVFSCGSNEFGQLGDESYTNSNKLIPMKIENIIVEKISAGANISIILSNEGNVYIYGYFNKKLKNNECKILKIRVDSAI
jgi:RCC1 and BTB domain-containing protein